MEAIKDHFLKVDVEISNNQKIWWTLAYFYVNKTDQILSQFQCTKEIIKNPDQQL